MCHRTIVSLTSHLTMVRIGHALLSLLRLGDSSPFDLRPDDARVVSGTRERRAASRAENHGERRETSDDQDPSTALQPLYPLVPTLQAQAAAQSAGLAGTERPTSPDSSHARALYPGRFFDGHTHHRSQVACEWTPAVNRWCRSSFRHLNAHASTHGETRVWRGVIGAISSRRLSAPESSAECAQTMRVCDWRPFSGAT